MTIQPIDIRRSLGRYTIRTKISLTLCEARDAQEWDAEFEASFDVDLGHPQSSLDPGAPANISIVWATINGEPAPDWMRPMLECDEVLEREMLAEAREADEAARQDYAEMVREERKLGGRA